MAEEEKIFKSPEEKKREEKLVEEKPREKEKAEAKEAAAEEKAEAAVAAVAKKEAQKEGQKEGQKAEKKKEKDEKKEKGGKKEKKREIVLQRVFVVPLDEAYFKPRSHRVRVAIRLLKAFIAKHLKTPLDKVRIAPELNSLVRGRGGRKPPKKVRVNASKDKDGVALAEPAK